MTHIRYHLEYQTEADVYSDAIARLTSATKGSRWLGFFDRVADIKDRLALTCMRVAADGEWGSSSSDPFDRAKAEAVGKARAKATQDIWQELSHTFVDRTGWVDDLFDVAPAATAGAMCG